MIDFEVKTVIDRPVSEVFAYATDPFRLATWQTNTVAAEQLDDGPLRRGSACARSIADRADASSSRPWR